MNPAISTPCSASAMTPQPCRARTTTMTPEAVVAKVLALACVAKSSLRVSSAVCTGASEPSKQPRAMMRAGVIKSGAR